MTTCAEGTQNLERCHQLVELTTLRGAHQVVAAPQVLALDENVWYRALASLLRQVGLHLAALARLVEFHHADLGLVNRERRDYLLRTSAVRAVALAKDSDAIVSDEFLALDRAGHVHAPRQSAWQPWWMEAKWWNIPGPERTGKLHMTNGPHDACELL